MLLESLRKPLGLAHASSSLVAFLTTLTGEGRPM
jgi:hypothetical protein